MISKYGEDNWLVVLVLATGKHEDNATKRAAIKRIKFSTGEGDD